MNPIWPNTTPNQTPEILKRFEEMRKEHAETLHELTHVAQNVAALEKSFRQWADAETVELIYVQPFEGEPFNAQGYKFNSLYVGDAAVADAAKVTINWYGTAWTITLQTGENLLSIPHGATIKGATTSGNAFQAVLNRYNMKR